MRTLKFSLLFLLLILSAGPARGVDMSPVEDLVRFVVKEKGAIALTGVRFGNGNEVELEFLEWYLNPGEIIRPELVLTDCVIKKNYLEDLLKTDSHYRESLGERSQKMLDDNGYQAIMFILRSRREPPNTHMTLCASESLHEYGIVGEKGHEPWRNRLFAALEANLPPDSCTRGEEHISCDNH